MAKSIIKEISIMLLLCIAIILILGILFYDYIPNNKVIPAKEAYSTPNDVKEEIAEQITQVEKTEISYEITDSDLSVYKQESSYKPGKADPFSLTEKKDPIINSIGNNNEGNTGTNTDTNEGLGNSFFDNTIIK